MVSSVTTSPRTRLVSAALLIALLLASSCGEREEPSAAVPGEGSTRASLDALRATGYASASKQSYSASESGVVLWDRERSAPGYNLYVNRYLCSAVLMDAGGELVKQWQRPEDRAWSNAQLLANGDLLVIGQEEHEVNEQAIDEQRYILRLSWEGEELWRVDLNAHHDLEVTPAGDLVALCFERVLGAPPAPPDTILRSELVQRLDLTTGELLATRSLMEVLGSRTDLHELEPVAAVSMEHLSYLDIIHANSVEFMRRPELAPRHPLYALGNVLVCSRHQDLIFAFEWESGELIWTWGRGEVSGPHDAHVLEGGNLLIFDNGLGRRRSRVIELDPVAETIVWEYQADPPESFYSASRGSAQRLPNGNTLIAESDKGQAFEVTPGGERVWSWINPERLPSGKALTIVRMKRLPVELVQAILAAH